MEKYTDEELDLLRRGIEAQNAKLARYEEALRFYAEPMNYKKVLVSPFQHKDESYVGRDNGETARKALEVEG